METLLSPTHSFAPLPLSKPLLRKPSPRNPPQASFPSLRLTPTCSLKSNTTSSQQESSSSYYAPKSWTSHVQHGLAALALSLAVNFCPIPAAQASEFDVINDGPPKESYVVDDAGVLSRLTKSDLKALLSDLEARKDLRINFVTVRKLTQLQSGPPDRSSIVMDRRLQPPHVKLLACDLLTLTVRHTPAPTFIYRGTDRPVVFAETLGYVVTRERKEKYLRFLVDDGTGCAPCVLWLNQRQNAAQGWRVQDPDPEFAAELAESLAAMVRIGALLRVRGRVTAYRGQVQVTVAGVIQEKDPNVQVLHWLDCVKLARCGGSKYPPVPPSGAASDGTGKEKGKAVASTSYNL